MNLLKPDRVAEMLGVSVNTLRNWRNLRKGPAYVTLGQMVRYHPRDVEDYMRKARTRTEPDQYRADDEP